VHTAGYTLVTPERPLERGEFAYLYATGLGRVDNQPPTGSGGPLTPLASATAGVRVTIGGVECDVQFAGLAPGFAGVFQVNFRVAENAPEGRVALVLHAGAAPSPAVEVPVE
jgi:minor extracellular serine protease Vpr